MSDSSLYRGLSVWGRCLAALFLLSVVMAGPFGGCETPISPEPVTDASEPAKVEPPPPERDKPKEQPLTWKDPAKLGVTTLCPGRPGCPDNKGEPLAGAAAVDVTPTLYELANINYFREEGSCPAKMPPAKFGLKRCGGYESHVFEDRPDCGLDGICPGDKIRTRLTCTKDEDCPTGMGVCDAHSNPAVTQKYCYIVYQKPDADGSEKDGVPDWFHDCGHDRICPCLDPNGKGVYYGKDKKCLIGHKSNPAYTGPDKDGTEGNGKFEAVWMAGFESNHPMLGVHDPIWARTVVIQTGDTTVAILSVDLVGLFYNSVRAVRELVEKKLPKGAIDYILISSTHTHEGPDSMGQWGFKKGALPDESGVNKIWFPTLLQSMADSVVKAYQTRKPVKLYAAKTRTGMKGFARDSRDPVIFDDTMMVLQGLDVSDDKPIFTLINWGNHPEALSDINNFNSSDFVHYVRDAFEKGVPDGTKQKGMPAVPGVAIYLQAAVGGLINPLRIQVPDLNGQDQGASDLPKIKALGQQVALVAYKALAQKKALATTNVSFWSKAIKLPVDNFVFRTAYALGIMDRPVYDFDPDAPLGVDNFPHLLTEIGLIRVGDATFFSMPGELEPSLLVGGYDGSYSFDTPIIDPNNPNPPDLSKAPAGPYLRERIPGNWKFFAGLANDQLGYLLPSYNYQLHPKSPWFKEADGDHYEETNSLGPRTLPMLMEAYKTLLGLAKPKAP